MHLCTPFSDLLLRLGELCVPILPGTSSLLWRFLVGCGQSRAARRHTNARFVHAWGTENKLPSTVLDVRQDCWEQKQCPENNGKPISINVHSHEEETLLGKHGLGLLVAIALCCSEFLCLSLSRLVHRSKVQLVMSLSFFIRCWVKLWGSAGRAQRDWRRGKQLWNWK